MPSDIYDQIPKNTFISEYMKECNNLETPRSYDFWSAVWIISLLVNKQLQIYRPNAPLFCNFYILLVGDSGVTRKSTSLHYTKQILDDIVKDTSSKIIQMNTIPTTYTMYKNIFGVYNKQKLLTFGINTSDFKSLYKNKDIINLLFNCYDNIKENFNYGSDNLIKCDCFISCISSTITDNYIKALTKEEIETGFTSRCITCYEEKGKRRIPWGKEIDTTTIRKYGRELVERIKTTRQLELSDCGIRRYSRWYSKRRYSTELYSRTFESREQDFVLKLAGLLAVNDLTFIITKQHIDLAIKIVNNTKDKINSLINDTINEKDDDNYDKIITKIQRMLRISGANGIYHSDLYNKVKSYCTNPEYNYIINVMHELGMLDKLALIGSKKIKYREGPNLFTTDIQVIKDKIILNPLD